LPLITPDKVTAAVLLTVALLVRVMLLSMVVAPVMFRTLLLIPSIPEPKLSSLSTFRVPPETEMSPEKLPLLLPDRVRVPLPVFVKPPLPLNTPEKVVLALLPPDKREKPFKETLPAPANDPSVSLAPRESVAPLATVTALAS